MVVSLGDSICGFAHSDIYMYSTTHTFSCITQTLLHGSHHIYIYSMQVPWWCPLGAVPAASHTIYMYSTIRYTPHTHSLVLHSHIETVTVMGLWQGCIAVFRNLELKLSRGWCYMVVTNPMTTCYHHGSNNQLVTTRLLTAYITTSLIPRPSRPSICCLLY